MARKSSTKRSRKGSSPARTTEETSKPDAGAVVLPERCDSSGAAAVAGALLARRGSALEVDAGQVTRLGAQCVEVLLSAVKTWNAAGLAMAIRNPSVEFLDTIQLLGFSGEDLMIQGA